MLDQISNFGQPIEQLIFWFAQGLASEGGAGIISGGIMIFLLLCLLLFGRKVRGCRRTVASAKDILAISEDSEAFAKDYKAIEKRMSELAKTKGTPPWSMRRAWEEYCETLLPPSDSEKENYRNTVRPSYFFNSEDLGYEFRFQRHLPSFFVSIGLFFTFLGIIAALIGLIGDGNTSSFTNENMAQFLDAAKSKFIMSLTGLLASIVFGLVYRWQVAVLHTKLDKFCDMLEERVHFLPPEQIATEQLKAFKAQASQLEVFGNNLGVQIGETVGASLRRELEPVLNRVNNSAGDSVGAMVEGIGDALYEKLNASLDDMSNTLGGVNKSLYDVTDVLKSSSAGVAEETQKSLGALAEIMERARDDAQRESEAAKTQRNADMESSKQAIAEILSGIEKNTAKGADTLLAAADQLSNAAVGLQTSIDEAGSKVGDITANTVARFGSDAEEKIGAAGVEITGKLAEATGGILDALNDFGGNFASTLGAPVKEFASELRSSTAALERHAKTVSDAADHHERAARDLANSGESMSSAIVPATRAIENMSKTQGAIRDTLQAQVSALESTRALVVETLTRVEHSLEALDGVVSNADRLEGELAAAFQQIAKQRAQMEDELRTFSEQVTDRFTTGIIAIQQTLDTIEDFKPARSV